MRGLRALGRRRVEGVAWDGGEIAADHLLLHDGVIPNTQISLALQLAHVWDEAQLCWRPAVDEWGRTSLPTSRSPATRAGIAGAGAAVSSGRLAALDAAHLLGRIDEAERDRRAAPLRAALARERAIRPFLDALYRPADAVLCPADDVDRLPLRGDHGRPDPARRPARRAGAEPGQGLYPLRHGAVPGPPLRPGRERRDRPRPRRADRGGRRLPPARPYKPITLGTLAGIAAPESDGAGRKVSPAISPHSPATDRALIRTPAADMGRRNLRVSV